MEDYTNAQSLMKHTLISGSCSVLPGKVWHACVHFSMARLLRQRRVEMLRLGDGVIICSSFSFSVRVLKWLKGNG